MRLLLVSALGVLASSGWAGPGLEIQAYPAGYQASGVWAQPLSERQEWFVTGGYNLARRWDWGLHADERGGGPGIGLGWRGFLDGRRGLNWAIRTELWFLDIAWRDQATVNGMTEVRVLQPAFELGWRGSTGSHGMPELGLSLGQEINVTTNGEAVGQGPILRGRIGWAL